MRSFSFSRPRGSILVLLTLLLATGALSCGKKEAATPENTASSDDDGGAGETSESTGDEAASTPKGSSSADPVTGEKSASKKPCEGFELDLTQVLSQASCETEKPAKDLDVKDKLVVKVVPSPNVIAKGGHSTITVTFQNKSKESIPLYFTVDPDPRFQIEVYDKKSNKRVDEPTGTAPPLPDSVANAQPPEAKTARATLVTQGTGTFKIEWDAVKYKWAPADRAKGAIPGRGYPKVAAGPLPKGKYVLKIAMPMVGVFEGLNREVSMQQAEIEIQ